MEYCKNGDTGILLYLYNDIIASKGQSGAPLQITDQEGNFSLIGMHVGEYHGKNYATMLTKNLFLDFLVPTLQELLREFGKYEDQECYAETLTKIVKENEDELSSREIKRAELQVKKMKLHHEQSERKLMKLKVDNTLRDLQIEQNIISSTNEIKKEIQMLKKDIIDQNPVVD